MDQDAAALARPAFLRLVAKCSSSQHAVQKCVVPILLPVEFVRTRTGHQDQAQSRDKTDDVLRICRLLGGGRKKKARQRPGVRSRRLSNGPSGPDSFEREAMDACIEAWCGRHARQPNCHADALLAARSSSPEGPIVSLGRCARPARASVSRARGSDSDADCRTGLGGHHDSIGLAGQEHAGVSGIGGAWACSHWAAYDRRKEAAVMRILESTPPRMRHRPRRLVPLDPLRAPP